MIASQRSTPFHSSSLTFQVLFCSTVKQVLSPLVIWKWRGTDFDQFFSSCARGKIQWERWHFSLESSGANKGKRATRLFDPEPLCQCHTAVKCTQRTWSCYSICLVWGLLVSEQIAYLAQQGKEILHSRLVVFSQDKDSLTEKNKAEISHLTSRSP